MTDTSSTHGLCPAPFMQEDLFPSIGGFVTGRWCEQIPLGANGNTSCCLPCPHAAWRYPNNFINKTGVANWIAVAIFTLNCLLLISFAALPVKWTHRHYLSVCLTVGIVFMELSFIVPLIAKPDECFNAITPNDMKSDLACAFSGSFIIFGGWAVIVWSFCRALSLHLQICWDVVPGNHFFFTTLTVGWILPAVGLALGLAITGVSYRFGSICHINHDNSLADFWGPLMGLAAAALVIQFVTLAYCIHVYIKSLLDNNPTTDNSSVRPSHPGSVRTVSARQAYRRVRRVIQLQWRGIAVVLTIIANVIFFTIIFLSLDNSARRTPELAKKSEPWIFCLVLSKGDKNKCAHLASSLGPNEASIFAVLVLLSLSGIWTIFFLGRYSMILGWIDLVKRKLMRSGEFVSVDARGGASTRDYEMINPPRKEAVKTPEPLLSSSPSVLSMSTVRFSTGKGESEVYAPEVRYTSPALSFSTPRPPSASQNHNNHGRYTGSRDWNPQTSFAQGNPQGSYWYGDSNH
ncbi:hypothetical protein, variant 2 [Blastomyces gilchristii SLH14081]|uniref:G-protein coupled receptors family 2 profile 2 domain-containing protein n=1 Tax=Blastomyces gilchristii (strain SLH14081) TaxID=559298 RepID=A0A179ULM9_BLAGS|nr:uncharacterized protein BDBG_04570 [Blastomyces gilchristii SLH14081]XP_031578583.1 hypothetical protein, variant 1 [Blastomyces gilchristii SLH14081]XP_031578584.1 hypothetical protein, variant 2 [Blastomyces gilchristii SLH14081]OAT08983.1 hypothetical protein BDBG_04570 [Blastomyces gilchristii SLH14081]OAT08984.1 hypothetical protein, variant 1 [Blastomyces gilchristii SLH14081]OAT08985.1 hypothetical protein, variant 2 [Blastomyces gilchristii SLH14081]